MKTANNHDVAEEMRGRRGTFNERVNYELTKQKQHDDKLRDDIHGIKAHGGLGYRFLRRLKIAIALILVVLAALGVMVNMKPYKHLMGGYCFLVLMLALTIAVIYVRRRIDKNME